MLFTVNGSRRTVEWYHSLPGRPHSRHPDRKAAMVGIPARANPGPPRATAGTQVAA